MYGEFQYLNFRDQETRHRIRIFLNHGQVPHEDLAEVNIFIEEICRTLGLIQTALESSNRYDAFVRNNLARVGVRFRALILQGFFTYKVLAAAGGERKDWLSWLLKHELGLTRNQMQQAVGHS